MNKKAIQLSINFLVIVIISLAIFGMGIVFVNKIFFSAGKKIAEMDLKTKEELAMLLDEGDKVAMPFFQKTVIHGKTATFGIGILNTKSAAAFTVVVKFDEAYDKANKKICDFSDWEHGEGPYASEGCKSDPDGVYTDQNDNGWLAYDHSPHTIEPNEQGKYTIAINSEKDTPRGVYIFNVAVCYSGGTYGAYEKASEICTPDPLNPPYGYYNLQKIWLTVK